MAWLILLCVILFILLTAYYLYNILNGSYRVLSELSSPPGSIPYIGHGLQFKPTQMHIWMHKQSRIRYDSIYNWYFDLVGMHMIILNNIKDIHFVLRNSHILFKKSSVYPTTLGWWCNDALLLNTGHRWSKQRKLLNPAFTQTRVIAQTSIIQDTAIQLCKRIDKDAISTKLQHKSNDSTNNTHDMYYKLSSSALDVLGRSAFDYKFNTLQGNNTYFNALQCIMKESYARLFRISNYIQGFNSQYKAKQGLHIVDCATNSMIKQRKNESDDVLLQHTDVLSKLIHTQRNNDDDTHIVTDIDLIKQVRLLTIAGSDTTAALMTNVLYYMSLHNDIQHTLQQQLDILYNESIDNHNSMPTPQSLLKQPLLQSVIRETLRLRPSIPLLDRQLNDDNKHLTLPSGLHINQHVNVTVNLYDLHRNIVIWGCDVDQFKPQRWLNNNSNSTDNNQYTLRSMTDYIQAWDNTLQCYKASNTYHYDDVYMPFGMGKAQCPGSLFATMEASIILAHLLHNCNVELSSMYNNIDNDIQYDYAISMIYPKGMYFKLTKRQTVQ